VHTNNNLVPEQYGFQQGSSTEDAAFKPTDSVFKTINHKLHFGRLFCDLAKAFHCVNHELSLAKLQHYGVQRTVLNWFRAYMAERKQN